MKAADRAGAARTGCRASAIPRDVSSACPALRDDAEFGPDRRALQRTACRHRARGGRRRDPRMSVACRRHSDRATRAAAAGARSRRDVRRWPPTRSFRPRERRPAERRHAFAASLFDERVETGGFGFQYRPSERGEAVVAAPFVARGAAPWFGDQGATDQACQRGVERAGAAADRACRALGDRENDSVAMAIAIAERQQDLELLSRQRQVAQYIVHKCIEPRRSEVRRRKRLDGWRRGPAKAGHYVPVALQSRVEREGFSRAAERLIARGCSAAPRTESPPLP